jgi:2-aminoadipate transaminase
VFYIGSFSKILGPALRVGWIVAHPSIIAKLSILKESLDINTATLGQHIVHQWLDRVTFSDHLEALRTRYRTRRDTMERALARELGGIAEWQRPSSGFFIWLRIPGVNAQALLSHALTHERLVFVPGAAFSADRAPRALSSLRLSYSNVPLDRIDDGVRALRRAVDAVLETTPTLATKGEPCI